MVTRYPEQLTLRPGHPDFLDLPWSQPMSEWPGICPRMEEIERGISRHPIVFVNYSGILYGIKELPASVAAVEYERLLQIEKLRLPAVIPVGRVRTQTSQGLASALITRYLERSIPYRTLFMGNTLVRYREHLLDAMAGLLVQLHLSGIFWGDCSLSNTLYRRDAGALQAYLVDAETAESYPEIVSPALRLQDLQIMEENVTGDLTELEGSGVYPGNIPASDTGAYIRLRYSLLWEEITHEDIINPDETYRIQERVRALNALGFSVGDIELFPTESGNQLRLRVVVSDRNFHRDQLLGLTGLEAEEMQARKIMNEIQQMKATLSQIHDRSTPLGVAAHQWLEDFYRPTIHQLQAMVDRGMDPMELYCQVLEHKWYLSERAQRDVGHPAATEDYKHRFSEAE